MERSRFTSDPTLILTKFSVLPLFAVVLTFNKVQANFGTYRSSYITAFLLELILNVMFNRMCSKPASSFAQSNFFRCQEWVIFRKVLFSWCHVTGCPRINHSFARRHFDRCWECSLIFTNIVRLNFFFCYFSTMLSVSKSFA